MEEKIKSLWVDELSDNAKAVESSIKLYILERKVRADEAMQKLEKSLYSIGIKAEIKNSLPFIDLYANPQYHFDIIFETQEDLNLFKLSDFYNPKSMNLLTSNS